jgi:O-antigen/teichoic acid export membrane protein
MTIRKSLGLSAITQAITFAFGLISVVVVSRVLTPQEIGIFSVAVALIGFAHILRDFGVGQYIVQAKQMSRDRLRAAFSVMLLISWSIAAVLFFARYPVASFYSSRGIAEVMGLLAVNFLLLPLGAPLLSVLRREMAFGKIAVVSIASSAVQTTVTITGALNGLSYMSMAWGSIAGIMASVSILLLIRPKDTVLLPTYRGLGEVLSFGSKSTLASLTTELGNGAPDLILGRTLGFDAVAYFSRAGSLRQLIIGRIQRVVSGVYFPAFAKGVREGGDPAQLYSRSMPYIIGVTAPLSAFLAVTAEPLIVFMFGPQWERSAPLASIMSLFALLTTPVALAGHSLIACGEVALVMRTQFVIQGLRIVVLLSSIWLALEQVVMALLIAYLAETVLLLRALRIAFGLRFRSLWTHIRSSYLLIPYALIGPLTLFFLERSGLLSLPHLPFLLASGFSCLAGWLTGVAILSHPLKREITRLRRAQATLKVEED